MPWQTRIPRELRHELDAIDVSAILEYVARRVELTDGKQELRVKFKDGRYQRAVDHAGRPIGGPGGASRRLEDRPSGP